MFSIKRDDAPHPAYFAVGFKDETQLATVIDSLSSDSPH